MNIDELIEKLQTLKKEGFGKFSVKCANNDTSELFDISEIYINDYKRSVLLKIDLAAIMGI